MCIHNTCAHTQKKCMLSRAKLSGFQVLKGRQREKRDRGVRYPKKGIDTSPLSYQARPGATTYLCISMGLSLTDEKVSMKLPGDNTRTSTPMPSTKIPSTGYKYQVSFHSFIYPFIHSLTQWAFTIYQTLHWILEKQRLARTVSVLKELTA